MNTKIRMLASTLVLGALVTACAGTAANAAPTVQTPTAPPSGNANAAASDAPATTTTTAATDACAIITEQEATAFLGIDPGAGMSTGTADVPACAYGGSLTISLVLTDGAAQYAAGKAAAQGSGKSQDLTGVGDQAYAFIVANTIADMEILKGSVLLSIRIQGDPTKQNVTAARLTTLGTTAVARV